MKKKTRAGAARWGGWGLSARQGDKLRRVSRRHGLLMVQVKADIRKYVGSHDVVSGVIRGADDPQDEGWAIAHSAEPGAIDNASGVAAMMELAQHFTARKKSGALKLKRDLLFAGWSGEELGLHGSSHYVKQVVPDQHNICCFNSDISATTNGNANVCLCQCWAVVHPVTNHCNLK